MSFGPMILFDKSALQMLNLDEATLFDSVFPTVICPIFYVEVLADLSKLETQGRTTEDIVSDLAKKTPVLRSYPNNSHRDLCLMELLGSEIEMRNAPMFGGGRPARHNGKVGLVYSESPEARAFSRWQSGQFEDVEREFASGWRAQLASMDLSQAAKLVKAALSVSGNPRNLSEAAALAKEAVKGVGQRFQTLRVAYSLLGLPEPYWRTVHQRWSTANYPSLPSYAPYTAYCLWVDVFFYIAIAKSLISPDRPSNKVDMAYLYYLPFCQIFTSNDRLHKNSAPLFMNTRQSFLSGDDLKKGMQELCAHVSGLPDDVLSQGLLKLSGGIAEDDRFLPAQLSLKTVGDRVKSEDITPPKKGTALHSELMQMVNGMKASAERGDARVSVRDQRNADHITIERLVPLTKGRWRILPLGIKADTL